MSDNPFALSNIEPQQDSAPASDNPFALGAIQRDQRQDLRVNLESAVRTNPQQAAEAARLAKKYETPDEVLLRNLQDVKLRDAVAEADKKLQTSPRLADYMRTSPFALKQAHDDIDALASIEKFFTDSWGSVKAGVYNANRGAGGLFQAVSEVIAPPLDWMESMTSIGGNPLRRLAEGFALNAQQSQASAKAAQPKTDGIVSGGVQSGIQSLTQNVLALPVAVMNPAAGLGMMSGFAGGQSYSDAREKGLTTNQALPYAASQAAIEAATEKIPLGKLLDSVKEGTPFFKSLVQSMAAEIPGEQVATVLQDLNEWAVLNPEKPFSSYLEERPSAAAQTLIATIVGTGGNVAVVKAAESVANRMTTGAQKARDAQAQVQKLMAAMQAAEASMLRTNNPDEFRAVMEHLAQDGKVYVYAQVLNQLPPEQLQALGVAESLPEALAANSSVEVKLSDLLTHAPGTPAAQVLIDNARATPDGLSAIEVQQAGDQASEFIKTEAERVLAEAQDATAWQDSTNKVKQGVLDQLNSAGRFSPEVNEAKATLHSIFFSVMAQRLSTTPEELFARYNLRVEAKLPGQVERLDQGGDVGLALNTLTRDDLEDDQVFSKPLPDVDSEDLGYVKKLGANSVGSGGFHVYVKGEDVREAGPHEFYFYDNSDEPIGFARLTKTRDQASVNMIAFTEDARGSGYGKAFYKYLLDELGVSVKSDKEITEGTAALYRSLAKEYGASVDSDGRVVISKQPNQSPARPLPDTIEVDGKQRPTTNSNGQPIAATEEGVRNFWKWFGDSKVVDASGKPLVVYHGTTAAIDEFRSRALGVNTKAKSAFGGFFFTNSPQNADEYSVGSAARSGEISVKEIIASWPDADRAEYQAAKDYREALKPKGARNDGWMMSDEWVKRNRAVSATFERLMEKNDAGPNTMPVYLSIQKPLEHDMRGAEYRDVSYADLIAGSKKKRRDGTIIRNTYDPLFGDVFIAKDPTQIKSAIGNSGEFDPANPNILMQSGNERDLMVGDTKLANRGSSNQSAEQPRLMAVHNLSAENLIFADKMGGLAVPSIGVVTQDAGAVDGFGEITLIGRKGLVDPKQERVFSADAYTVRFPKPEWPKVKSKDAQALVDFVRAAAKEFNDHGLTNETLGHSVNTPDASKVVETWLSSSAVRAVFLREKGVDVQPVTRDTKPETSLTSSQLAEVKDLFDATMVKWRNGQRDTAELTELAAKVETMVRSNLAAEGLEGAIVDEFASVVVEGLPRNLYRDYAKSQVTADVDIWGTKTKLNEQIEPYAIEFKQWVESKIIPKFGDPFIKVGGKKAPYTLDNIVKTMTDTKVKGKEKTMTYGAGQVRAAASVEFSDLEQMRAAAVENVVDPAQYEAAKAETEKKLEDYRSAVVEFTNATNWKGDPDTWEALDASMRALAKWSTGKKRDATSMKAALRAEDFNVAKIPDSVIEQAMDAAGALLRAPVPYFEAKPQRAVSLGEFAGAVIPTDAPQQVRDILAKNNVPVTEYEPGADRAVLAREFAAQLAGQGQDTLFQSTATPTLTSLPDTIEIDGKQRSTTNSNGQPIAATEEGVRNFWKWFGDSKVVDASGKPLVVYHGTASDFTEFKPSRSGNLGPGIYFTPDIEQAQAYARTHQGAQVVKAYLSVQNPLRIDNSNASSEQLYGAFPGKSDAETVANMRAAGYDAVWAVNSVETRWGPTTREIAVYDPTQIKSAIGNSGEFDPANPSILAQNSQAPRGTYSPSQVLITLGENADLSTFLHESWHFFLEVMADLASQPDAPAGVVDNFNTFLKWAGVPDAATWNAMTLDQKRPYHEKWAEAFEQYLLEGKAPTAELQPLFRRFSAWLKNVYKSLTEFMRARDLKVSDEIRGVFDRMLATDEQIRQAEDAAGMLPDFDATNEAIEKLQARSLRDLKWTVGARSKALKALQREAANLRKAVKAEVTAEVEQMPEFKAQREIAEFKRENKRKANDVEMAIIAEANGFESADAMTKAIDLVGKKADMIEGKTDQRMLENFGELATPEALEAAANDAVHNEARARALATELKAQADMLNPRQDTGRTASNGRSITVNALTAAAKQFAQNLTARRRVKDLKNAAWQHRSAESRAAKAWQEATAKGKTEEAVAAKRDQLLNNYTAKAMGEAQAEVRKVLEFFAKVTKGNNEKLVDKGRDPDVVNAARAVLAAYDIAPRLEKTANDYMEAVAKYDAQMYGALKPGLDAMLANAKPFGELTVDEMRALRDEIGSMWELAKTSRQMEIDGDRVDIDDAAQDLVNRMVEIGVPDEIPGEKGAITNRQELGIKLQFAKAILSRVEQWAERMDGKFGGPFLRYVFQPVKDAADRYRAARVQHREKFTKLVEGVAPFIKPGPIAAPELGYTFGNARDSGMAELLHALIHTGNDSNKRKLLLGRNWATENADGTLDTTRWDTFVARLISEGTLRKEHYDFAQGVWDLLEETKPLAQEAHRKVFGRYFAEVTANEFTTPFGVYRGGYAPAQTDSRLVGDAKLRELAEGENESMAYAFPSAPSGFTKSRVEYNKPLLLDLRALAQHMDKVLLFSHMQPAISDARRLLTRKNVSYALDRIDPGAYEGMIMPWLNRSAKQIVETPVAGDRKLSRFLSAARSRAGMAMMMANLSNTVQQITGFSTAAIKVKPSLMLKAVGQFTASPKEFKRTVVEVSPFMKDRMLNELSSMNDIVEQILVDPTLLEKGQAWTQKHAYFLQSAVDNTMSPIIWTAAYNQAIEEGSEARDAVRFADGVIRQTQGSTLPEDVSRFETGPAVMRVFTQFVGYFNMMANTNATAMSQVVSEMGVKKGAGKLAYIALAGLLVPIWVAEAIAQAFRGGPGDEDDDGYLDDWLMAVFGLGTIRGLTATVPIAGQVGQMAVSRFNNNPADDKFSLSPAVSLIESAVGSPASVYKAIIEDGNAQKAVRDVAAAATLLTGLPFYAAARPVGYAAGVAQGKIEPTDAVDAVRGTVTGTASKESKTP